MATAAFHAVVAAILASWLSRAVSVAIIEQLSPCKVRTDGGLVDFSALAGTAEQPGFPDIASPSGALRRYDWNPCTDFRETKEKSTKMCQGVALCRIDDNLPKSVRISSRFFGLPSVARYYNFGNQSSAKFVSDNNQLVLQMTNSHQPSSVARIILQCNNSNDEVLCTDDGSNENPTFILTGRHLCYSDPTDPDMTLGVSIGTLLCITLLAVVFLYVALGVTYKRVRKHATGEQLIPNVEFWKALPGYAKDGVLYIKTGCRPRGLTHENI